MQAVSENTVVADTTFDVEAYMLRVGQQARQASRAMAAASTAAKNTALLAMADAIDLSLIHI